MPRQRENPQGSKFPEAGFQISQFCVPRSMVALMGFGVLMQDGVDFGDCLL